MTTIRQSRLLQMLTIVALTAATIFAARPAHAVLTSLADQPLQALITAKPNIVFTIDDSTSMGMDALPDYVIGNNAGTDNTNYCRRGDAISVAGGLTLNNNNAACGYGGDTGTFGYGYTLTMGTGTTYVQPGNFNPRAPMMAASFNRMYYNPVISYTPPVQPNGVSLPTMNAANTLNWTRVFKNNWWNYPNKNPTDATVVASDRSNLAAYLLVVRWCNTDWWLGPTTDECRANGIDYSSGTPAATADYNYPFHTNTLNDNRNYYYRTKTLYCDRNMLDNASGSMPANDPTCPAAVLATCAANQYCAKAAGSCAIWNPWVQTPPTPPGQCPTCSLAPAECPSCTRTCNTFNPPTYSCVTWSPSKDTSCKANYVSSADNASDGSVCRHANVTYTTAPTGPVKVGNTFGQPGAIYPPTTVSGNQVNINCGTVPDLSVPRHYYKVGVEWCNAQVAGTTAKWKTYGTGTCQSTRDPIAGFKYPRFYQYLGEHTGNQNVQDPAFTKVTLDYPNRALTPNFSHDYWDPVTSSIQTITRSWDQEMENYANWYAYYRTRMLATKSVTALAFNNLNNKVRVGFHTLNNTTVTGFLNVADFDTTQKSNFIDKVEKLPLGLGMATPTLDAMTRVGEWFRDPATTTLPGATDPINLSCQRNFHMLFTDGATDQLALPAPAAGDQDKTVPALPQLGTPPAVQLKGYGQDLTPTQPWPAPIQEGATVTSTTLADVALKYWSTDLRTAGAYAQDNGDWSPIESPTSGDIAWQRLNFAALSLGAEGSLAYVSSPLPTNWPNPNPPYRPTTPQYAIDDLWHATVNGFGSFVNANDPADLAFGMNQMLANFSNASGARAGNASASPNLDTTLRTAFIYKAGFAGGWTGILEKIQIDPATGVPLTPTVSPWEAGAAITAQLTPTVADPQPWFSKRLIVTVRDTDKAKVPFRYPNLSPTQQGTFGSSATQQQNVIAYLRGDKSLEGARRTNLRPRSELLGDIVDAQAVIVGDPWNTNVTPAKPFSPITDPGYSAFAFTHAGREQRIYVAANDGMIHAINDNDGTEHWAYVPSSIIRPWDQQGMVNLSFQVGGSPLFFHYFYADATPRVADVDMSGTAQTGPWKTILVGGLGKGGPMVYALDVTDPITVVNEGDAATKIMWEFTNDNLGLTYGRPLIVKTRAHGWVVVVASGYNNAPPLKTNGDGKGHLFFLDPNNGAVLKEMVATCPCATSAAPLNVGSTASPSGLAHIAGFVKDFHDQTVEQIYGGDLNGNVWRFDVHDANPANWNVDWFAELKGPTNAPQPVTTEPQIEVDFATAIDRWVMIGTGRLLDDPDLADNSVQSVYSLRDGTINAMKTTSLPIRRSTLSAVVDKNGLGSKPADGWFDDLTPPQRVVVDVKADLNVIAYVGTEPGTDACIKGQPGDIFAREFTTGASVLPVDVSNPSAGTTEFWSSAGGGVGLDIISISKARGGTPDDPILPPTLELAVTRSADGQRVVFPINLPPLSGGNRMSWRIIGE